MKKNFNVTNASKSNLILFNIQILKTNYKIHRFMLETQLTDHEATHNTDVKRSFVCETCGKG